MTTQGRMLHYLTVMSVTADDINNVMLCLSLLKLSHVSVVFVTNQVHSSPFLVSFVYRAAAFMVLPVMIAVPDSIVKVTHDWWC